MSARRKRKLVVTGQKPITNMKLRNGGTATLFEVFAKNEKGEYVEEALRAFTELDVGQLIEYEIEPYNHKLHGMSYTLTPPKKETARRLRELEEQMAAMIGWAKNQGFNLQRALGNPEAIMPSAAEAAAAEARKKQADADASERFGADDDVPWTDDDVKDDKPIPLDELEMPDAETPDS